MRQFGEVACVCCAGAMLLNVVALWVLVIRYGDRLRRRESPRARRVGTALVAVCCLLPFAVYYGPSLYTRATLGRWPLGTYPNGVIREGMTRDEVHALLGEPNNRDEWPDREAWYYSIDAMGASYFSVHFSAEGRVMSTGGD